MTEEPTQRIRIRQDDRAGYSADAPTTAMPGPLDLTAETAAADSSTTDVLSLDELFETEPTRRPAPPASHEAPTWTAMPVVPIRSEPVAPAAVAPPAPAPAQTPSASAGSQLRTDAAAAWEGVVRRTRGWLQRDDNALMLLTALVAVILILAVAALSR